MVAQLNENVRRRDIAEAEKSIDFLDGELTRTSNAEMRRGISQLISCRQLPTRKHPKVKAWLARRPRIHLHFTPTYTSWLNQVERWFGLITQQAIRRGSFKSVSDLTTQIKTLRGALQRLRPSACMDCHGGFDPLKGRTHM